MTSSQIRARSCFLKARLIKLKAKKKATPSRDREQHQQIKRAIDWIWYEMFNLRAWVKKEDLVTDFDYSY